MDSVGLNIILSLTSLGLIFGVGLAYAQLKFGKELDPRVHEVEEILPKGQCGACGFAGCSVYAEEVVINPGVPPDRCIPGKGDVARLVARITGKEAKEVEEVKAHIRCNGRVEQSFLYDGLIDCQAANLLFGGDKACSFSCLGYGSCVKECKFGGLTLPSPKEIPSINASLCTGCGACLKVCPKGVIELVPVTAKVLVFCNSKDKGTFVKKICKAGCIGCRLCEKTCQEDAILIEDNVARILYDKCTGCGECVEKCPTGSLMKSETRIDG